MRLIDQTDIFYPTETISTCQLKKVTFPCHEFYQMRQEKSSHQFQSTFCTEISILFRLNEDQNKNRGNFAPRPASIFPIFKKGKDRLMRECVAYILGEWQIVRAGHVLETLYVAVQCIAPRQVVSRAKTGSRQDKVSSSPGRLQI